MGKLASLFLHYLVDYLCAEMRAEMRLMHSLDPRFWNDFHHRLQHIKGPWPELCRYPPGMDSIDACVRICFHYLVLSGSDVRQVFRLDRLPQHLPEKNVSVC